MLSTLARTSSMFFCDARKPRRSDERDGRLRFRWLDAVSGMRERGQFSPLACGFMFACSLFGRLRRGLFGCSGRRTFGCPWMVRRGELDGVSNVLCAVLFCLYLSAGFLDDSVWRPVSDSSTCLSPWYSPMRCVYMYDIHVTRTASMDRIISPLFSPHIHSLIYTFLAK